MSKMQRDKGKRFEREVVNTLKESGFFGAKRIPLSGLQESRAGGFKLIYDAKEQDDADKVFIKQDRKPVLVVMSLEDYIKGEF